MAAHPPLCPGCGRYVYEPEAHMEHLFDAVQLLKDELDDIKRRVGRLRFVAVDPFGDDNDEQ